ncbi:phosphoribosylglycinamide formyltransferase [Dethiothermospora halolimnae]|uniref:phosphoribosylglycinamide formyltransferase n=1 Tax=Dethiothermospora halolimnae TaxID=3114390 RepID=UPI003CCC0D38
MSPLKIAVLISGGGTNLQAIIDSIKNGYINGKIEVVVSNKKEAYGLVRAEKNNIDNIYINRKEFSNDIEYNNKIISELKKRNINLVVLAGYLKILSEEFIDEFENKIINIHPSLIPSFCGKGYYGRKVHEEVLKRGVKITGATVHYVDKGTDTGPIIIQESVRVEDDDDVDSLQKKVLEVEHEILIKAIKIKEES